MLYSVKTTIENNVMGEWSEYFEQFPEEDPANQPPSAEQRLGPKSKHFPQWHESQLTKVERAIIQAKFEKEQAELLALENEVKNTPIHIVDACPCCYAERMEIRLLKDNTYYCKCSACGVDGKGGDLTVVMDELSERIWNIDAED